MLKVDQLRFSIPHLVLTREEAMQEFSFINHMVCMMLSQSIALTLYIM